jgi:hypothetical protein
MEKELNGRVIASICKICSIKHGAVKEPENPPNWHEGLCDICEATGVRNVPQNVADVSFFGGLVNDLLEFTNHSPSL